MRGKRTERHDQIQLVGILEAKLEGNDERVVHQCQHRPFRKNMRDLPRSTSNMRFSNRFQSIYTLSVLFADHHDFAEGAFTDDFEKVEGFDG